MGPAWEIYYDEFHRLAERVPGQQFGRDEAYATAAHAAYRLTADRLTAEGWTDDRTLHLVRGLNEATKGWIEGDGASWDGLRRRLADMAGAAGEPREGGGTRAG